MGLALPLALLGALFVGLPILAHLRRRRDLPTRDFPAVALLRRMVAQSDERLRIRDRLLLGLRIAVMILVAFAAAGPFLWRAGAFRDGRRASLLVVIDNSMSTEGTFADLRDEAAGAIDALPRGSEVAILLASAPARVLHALSDDLEGARLALVGLTPSARSTDLTGAARLAPTALAGAQHTPRMLVLSDFPGNQDARWPAVESAFVRLPVEGERAAIVEAHLAPDPTRPGHSSIRFRLEAAEGSHDVALIAGEQELASTTVDVPAFGRGRGQLSAPIGTSSDEVTLVLREAAEDPVHMDDRWVLPTRGAARRVLLVDGNSAQSEFRFIDRALSVAPPLTGGGHIETHRIDAARLDQTPLDAFDLIIVASANVRTAPLTAFVEGGGGVLVFAGDGTGRGAFDGFVPARMGDQRTGATRLGGGTGRWSSIEANASRYVLLDPAPGAEVLLRWTNGEAALVHEGRIAVLGTTADDDWTDLPLHPGFIPLLHGLVEELARPARQGEYEAGTSIPLVTGTEVILPDGERVRVDESPFTRTDLPGVYRATSEGRETLLAVHPGAGESRYAPGPLPVDRNGTPEAGSASKHPLAPWLFLFFGLLLVVEGWLRTRKRLKEQTPA